MKNIKLLTLALKNFKGIKEFALDTRGENVRVLGDNAVGKTSIFDGFMWNLFDKDSQNKKDFAIKTLDENGNEIHGLEHSVELTFDVEGDLLVLGKVFKEKWSKKRGSAQAVFSGHTTDYFINGVPSKKKEYTDKVDELVNEDIFKLLTNVSYFNEQLHWQDRRRILLEISGDVSNEEVIATNNELSPLIELLSNRSIEDHKKIILAKRAEINKELDRLPVRIDEVQRSVADVSGLDIEELHEKIKAEQVIIAEKEAELSGIMNGSEIMKKQNELQQLKLDAQGEKQTYQQENFKEVNEVENTVRDKQSKVRELSNDASYLRADMKRKMAEDDRLSAERDDLLGQWKEINAETFDEHSTSCPTCKQDLPEEQVAEAIEHFNLNKSKRLEMINTKGRLIKSQRDTINKEIEEMKANLNGLEEQLEKVKEEVLSLEASKSAIQVTPFEETETFKSFVSQEHELEATIQHLRDNANEAVVLVRGFIQTAKERITALQQELSKFDQVEKANERVKELEAKQKGLAKEFEKIEHELFLIEEFTRNKVELLESKINSKFKYARFMLFAEQVNGGLQETCETLFEGVPFSKGLNNAARINVGLDIINTLSKHYGVQCPIFIDNAESITKLIDVDSQVIQLVVSEADQTLRTEIREGVLVNG